MRHSLLFAALLLLTPFAAQTHAELNKDCDPDLTATTTVDPQSKIWRNIQLLNRVFLPLVDKLAVSCLELTDQDVANRLNAYESSYPILGSRFTGRSARVGGYRIAKSQMDESKQTTIYGITKPYFTGWIAGLGNYLGWTERRSILASKEVDVFSDFFWLRPESDVAHREFHVLITPIGEYGPKFAGELLRTSEIMMELTLERLPAMARETYLQNKDFLHEEAARTRLAPREVRSRIEISPLYTVLEGVVSLHQLITTMLAEKIPGLETGEEALRAFTRAHDSGLGLTAELTSSIPLGLLGPTHLSGVYFKNPLVLNAKKELSLSASFAQTLKAWRMICEKSRGRRVCPLSTLFTPKTAKLENTPDESGDFQHVTGLQTLAQAYLKVFEQVHLANSVTAD